MEKKTKEVEVIKDINEDVDTIKKFIYILVGVAVVAVGLYFISTKLLIKDGVIDNEVEHKDEEISYTTVLAGNVFNRPEENYYVLAYDADSSKASIYAAVLNTFNDPEGKIYFMDLGLEANKPYVKEESNKKPINASELALKEPTLIKIKGGKVDKYLEDLEEIKKELKR